MKHLLSAVIAAAACACISCASGKTAAVQTEKTGTAAITPVVTRIWSGCAMSPRRFKVKLYAYLPPKEIADGSAAIVMPGGSYIYMGIGREGHAVAEFLVRQGTAAFVLSYRTAMQWNHHPAMAQDVQRALQLVKENAAAYNVNPNMVGVMGFSAGGHLAGFAAEYFDTNFMAELGVMPQCSLKPAFAAMIYPVVTMDDPYAHVRSRRHLLGSARNDTAMRTMMSLEKNVRADMPPVFLVQCTGDKTVDYRNAVLMDSALAEAGVEHRFLLFEEEGHGFGVDKDKYPGNEAWTWGTEFIPWMRAQLGTD